MKDMCMKGTKPNDASYDHELTRLTGNFFGVTTYNDEIPTITQYPRDWIKNSAVLCFDAKMSGRTS